MLKIIIMKCITVQINNNKRQYDELIKDLYQENIFQTIIKFIINCYLFYYCLINDNNCFFISSCLGFAIIIVILSKLK
jgi:hypothetical protein